jgi:6-phosphogluconolactonase (cycloisomerase 2 family)
LGTGRLSATGEVAVTPSPSFLAWHPFLPVLYCVNELPEGTVSAWAVESGGVLRALGGQATGGAYPCHLAVTPDGRHLLSANYMSGSVSVHRLESGGAVGERTDLRTHDGAGPDPDRQTGPHAHMVSPDPDGDGLFVVDLGADTVFRYVLDPDTGRLSGGPGVVVRPGSGPRHLARHPDGRRAFLVGELDATVTGYRLDPQSGELVEYDRVPASGSGGAQPSEIRVGRDGRRLYVANRGVDTVAIFDLDGSGITRLGEVSTGGEWPRHLTVIGDHLYVANERSHTVMTFRLGEDGLVDGSGDLFGLLSPTCVLAGKSF